MKRLILALLTLLLTVPCAPLSAQPPDTTPAATVLPMSTRLRLRDVPAFDSRTVAYLEPGAVLVVLGRTTDSNWLYVRAADDALGWVLAAFLDFPPDVSAVPVTTDLARLSHPLQLAPDVAETVRAIFSDGQARGNHPDVFSKVGDSITAAPHMLNALSDSRYHLGDYQYLQAVIDYFSASPVPETGSFARVSLAAGVGWTTDAVFKAKFADSTRCLPAESPLDCEYRVAKPAFALIMFGTNDVAHLALETYTYNLGRIVKTSIGRGVVPILSTIPLRLGYDDQTAAFNAGVIKVARRYHVPLWDYGAAMQDLPDSGLAPDGVHPSIPPNGYKGSVDFRAPNLYYGYVIRNLTALQMLDACLLAVTNPPAPAG